MADAITLNYLIVRGRRGPKAEIVYNVQEILASSFYETNEEKFD